MKTQYYKNWEEYKAEHSEIDEKLTKKIAPKMQQYEEMMFMFVMNLLM
jgi:ABC-type Zn uptake system ZnuABC Zn-binding protein ZnuA